MSHLRLLATFLCAGLAAGILIGGHLIADESGTKASTKISQKKSEPAKSVKPAKDATDRETKKTPKTKSSESTKLAKRSDRNLRADPRTRGVVIKKATAAQRAKGEITFDDLKFDIEKDAPFADELLDDDVKSLDGINVRLRGYILPSSTYKDTDIRKFVLVRDNRECCFGPGAALFDCVMIEMKPGKTADYETRPVTVHGKLKIDTKSYKYPGGRGPRGATHLAIFRIEGDAVK